MPRSSIKADIKQTRPFLSAGHEAAVALLRTASVVRRSYEQLCQDYDITLQQYNVIRILRGSSDPLPTMEVAARMVEFEPGITRLIGRLCTKGLVEKVISSEDARIHLCSITRKGKNLVDRLDQAILDRDNHVVSQLSNDEVTSLLAMLTTIRETV